jgi:hypothetical protein
MRLKLNISDSYKLLTWSSLCTLSPWGREMKKKHALIAGIVLGLSASALLWRQSDQLEVDVSLPTTMGNLVEKNERPLPEPLEAESHTTEADELDVARSQMQEYAQTLENSGDHAAIGLIERDRETDAAEHGMAEMPDAATDGPSTEETVALNEYFSSRIPGEETANEEVKVDQESEQVEQTE